MNINYDALVSAFWNKYPQRDDYKPLYGIVYLAAIQHCHKNEISGGSDQDVIINNYAQVSWNTYYAAMRWLDEVGLILYQKGENQNKPSKFRLISLDQFQASRKSAVIQPQVGSDPAASQPQVSAPPAYIHEPARAEVDSNFLSNKNKPPISPEEQGKIEKAWRGVAGFSKDEKIAVEYFLTTYGKPGDYLHVKSIWDSYTAEEQHEIFSHLPAYLDTFPGERAQYRANPVNFLKGKQWIAVSTTTKKENPLAGISKDGDYESLKKPQYQAANSIDTSKPYVSAYYEQFLKDHGR